jgi:hypothetical protein
MASFPTLKTGAIAQYPAGREIRFSTHVIRFLSGQEQRYRQQACARRQWLIELHRLDEEELEALEAFFQSVQGQAGSFEFTDPFDQTVHSNCTMGHAWLEIGWTGPNEGHAALVVTANGE